MKRFLFIAIILISLNINGQTNEIKMTEHLKIVVFNGETLEVPTRSGWYVDSNDITWVYARDPKNAKRTIKIGFSNNFTEYILDSKFLKRFNNNTK